MTQINSCHNGDDYLSWVGCGIFVPIPQAQDKTRISHYAYEKFGPKSSVMIE